MIQSMHDYSDNTNTLLFGDSAVRLRELEDNSIDLTVTSPPYDKLRTYNGIVSSWSFEKFQAIAKELFRVTKEGGAVVWVVGDATVKGSETGTSFRQALYFKEIGFNLHDTMIYKKNGTGACGSNLCYWQTFEYMFVLTKGRPNTVNRLTNGKKRTAGGKHLGRVRADGTQKIEIRSSAEGKEQIRNNIWEYNVGFCSGDERTGHPAVFPYQLALDHILSWSKEGDTILDPFMGSGTTGLACAEAGRKFIGIEMEPSYYELSIKRITSDNVSQLNQKS